MAMSDCIRCDNTPCTCGWDYRYWSTLKLLNQIDRLQKVIEFKATHPNIYKPFDPKVGISNSCWMGPKTEDDFAFIKFLEME